MTATVDALRVLAMTGVVLGHRLVTAVLSRADGLHVDSPLRPLPYLWPASRARRPVPAV